MRAHVRARPDLADVSRACRAAAGLAAEAGLPEEAASDLRLALEEVLVNVVRHGGIRGAEDRISVRLSCDEAGVEVEVRDPGEPFDPLGHPSPALDRPLEEREPGGLGILLFRSVARNPQYCREPKENVLRFRIPRAGAPTSLPRAESRTRE